MFSTLNDTKKEKLKDAVLGLHWAATTGNVGLIKFALDHGVPIDSVVNGFVPLQLACISDNNIAAVQYLIDRGADVNVQKWSKKHSVDKTQAVPGATGSTALHVACANGCIKIVDLLIRNNARIQVKDKYGSTPLGVAQAKHETEIVKLLLAARENQQQQPRHHQKHRSMSCGNDDQGGGQGGNKPQKSIESSSSSLNKTHRRTSSDKQPPRIRRPSLPSIFEGHGHLLPQNVPSFISMTPSSSSTMIASNSSTSTEPSSRQSFSGHRTSWSEEMSNTPLTAAVAAAAHSCPTTPRTSLDIFGNSSKRYRGRNIPFMSRSPRSSEDSSAIAYSTSPPSHQYVLNPEQPADGHPDWYGYGVVNPYDQDDNYLLSLERRAYNLSCNENGELERHSQDSSRRSVHCDSAAVSRRRRRRSTVSSSDEQQQQQQQELSDLYIHAKRNDSSDSGIKLRTTALKNAMAATNNNAPPVNLTTNASDFDQEYGYDGELDEEDNDDDDDDDDYEEEEEEDQDEQEAYHNSESLPGPSVVWDSSRPEAADLVRYRFLPQNDPSVMSASHSQEKSHHHTDPSHQVVEANKKGWFSGFGKDILARNSLDNNHSRKSLDFRPSFENFTQFAKRGVPNILGQYDNKSDDDLSDDQERNHQQQQQQQKNGFFSRWAPAWSKKQ